MSEKDYYGELGLKRGASPREVRSAYRRLARQCHPDVNQADCEAPERFRALTEAYEVLSDPDRRRKYDSQPRAGGPRFTASRQPASGGPPWPSADRSTVSSGSASGARRRPMVMDEPHEGYRGEDRFSGLDDWSFSPYGRSPRGASLEIELELTPEEAYLGTGRVLAVGAPGVPSRWLEIEIPSGVENGTRLGYRVPGPSTGGAADGGRLEVVIRVQPYWR